MAQAKPAGEQTSLVGYLFFWNHNTIKNVFISAGGMIVASFHPNLCLQNDWNGDSLPAKESRIQAHTGTGETSAGSTCLPRKRHSNLVCRCIGTYCDRWKRRCKNT